jgi:glycosidase
MLNHTGPNHKWFVSARSDVNSPYRNYYNFSPTQINNTWRSNSFPGSTGGYYEGVFSPNMPDLNWNEPKVYKEFEEIVDFWLERGVSGFRLDAIKHVFEIHGPSGRQQDHKKNRELVRWFNNYCASKKADVILVGEVWSAQSEVLTYIAGPDGSGGGLMSCFNFDMRDSITNGIKNANANTFSTRVVNNWNAIKKVNPLGMDSVFLGNHDTPRFANEAGANIAGAASAVKIKMGALVSLFAPGNPYVYYGDEIGALNGSGGGGDDRYRCAMQWVSGNPLGLNMATGRPTAWTGSSVAAQINDPDSILQFYIKTINLKSRYPQIHWGQPTVIQLPGNAVSAYKVNSRGQMRDLAVVHNHGSTGQTVTIPGAKFLGGHVIVTGTTEPTLNGTTLVIPGYSLAIIEL